MSFAKVMRCPVCNGEIRADAIRCRGCGALLADGVTSGGTARRFRVVLLVIAMAAASLAFFTLSRAGKADIHAQSMAADQTTTR